MKRTRWKLRGVEFGSSMPVAVNLVRTDSFSKGETRCARCGEMSLVGSRPHSLGESKEIEITPSEILCVSSEIRAPYQVSRRNHKSSMERAMINVYCASGCSVWLDIVMLARTVRSVIFDRSFSERRSDSAASRGEVEGE